ncbi:MAG: rod shape-determining protein MreC [Vulcanimicrobiaceae bacterium]
MIVAAVIALVQLDAAKNGRPSLIAVAVSSIAVYAQSGATALGNVARDVATTIGDAPRLSADNAALRARSRTLQAENDRLREALAQVPEARAIAELAASEPGSIAATTIGYDPENVSRTIVLDRGANAGVARDDGVIDAAGVVGRIVDVTPATSTVLLVTDGASKVPAVVQRGRWWGIATGTSARLRLQYVSQDAKLKIGDRIVTGAGRSFRAGIPIGTITRVVHPEGSLYQTALVEPAVTFGRISRVLVLPRFENVR